MKLAVFATLAFVISTSAFAKDLPKITVTPVSEPAQQRLLRVEMQAAKNEIAIIDINTKLIGDLKKLPISSACLSDGNVDACDHASKIAIGVMKRVFNGFQNVRTNVVTAEDRITKQQAFKTTVDNDAYNSLVNHINARSENLLSKAQNDVLADSIALIQSHVLGGALTAHDKLAMAQGDFKMSTDSMLDYLASARIQAETELNWYQIMSEGSAKLARGEKL